METSATDRLDDLRAKYLGNVIVARAQVDQVANAVVDVPRGAAVDDELRPEAHRLDGLPEGRLAASRYPFATASDRRVAPPSHRQEDAAISARQWWGCRWRRWRWCEVILHGGSRRDDGWKVR